MEKYKFKNILLLASSLALTTGSLSFCGCGLISCSTTSNKYLVLDSEPNKISYKVGEKFSLDGISVYAKTLVDGIISNENSEVISDYSCSISEGSVLDQIGEKTVTISKNGYNSASFKITVGENIKTKQLKISTLPLKVSYRVGEKFTSNGIKVKAQNYVDGVESGNGSMLQTGQFSLSIADGTTLNTEGSFLVYVLKDGYESTKFTISVLTTDTSFKDMMETIQNSQYYTMDIYNTVATTVNEYGFHYRETVTPDYFSKITFKKSAAEEDEEDRGLKIDSNIAYVNYDQGVYQVDLKDKDDQDLPKAGKILSSETKWYKTDLADTFDSFDLSNIPDYTKSGKFVIEVKLDEAEKNANANSENEDWTTSLAKNPFAEQFLTVCGWSTSLISILTTIDVTIVGGNNPSLELKGNIGSYGYTSIKVTNINSEKAKINELENYMQVSDRCYDKTTDELLTNSLIQDLFINNTHNYSRDLSLSFTDGTSMLAYTVYYGDNYIWFQPSDAFRNFFYNAIVEEYTPSQGEEGAKKTALEAALVGNGYIRVTEENATLKAVTGYGTGIFSLISEAEVSENPFKISDKITKLVATDVTKQIAGNVDILVNSNTEKPYYTDEFYNFNYEEYMLGSDYGIEGSFVDFASLRYLIDPNSENSRSFTWFNYDLVGTETAPFLVSYDEECMQLFCEQILGADYETYKSYFNSAVLCPDYEVDGDDNITGLNGMEFWLLNMSTLSGYYLELYDFNNSSIPEYVSSFMTSIGVNL